MAKGYWIVSGDVHDPQGYKAYMAANAAALIKYKGRFVVRGGRAEAVEGKGLSRNVVVEFDSFEAALACFYSPEYTDAKKLPDGLPAASGRCAAVSRAVRRANTPRPRSAGSPELTFTMRPRTTPGCSAVTCHAMADREGGGSSH